MIFDWDGTLVNSVPRITASLKEAAKKAGLAIPENSKAQHVIGLSMSEAVDALFGQLTEFKKQLFTESYKQAFRSLVEPRADLFARSTELLSFLNDKNIALAVATGKARVGLERSFLETDTKLLFVDSICSDEALSKPHPDMIHKLISRNKWHTEKTVLVGDTSHDVLMGKAAGVYSVGISHGAHSAEMLKLAGADSVISCLTELKALIDQLNS